MADLPTLNWELFSVPWSEPELVVVWSVTPKRDQSYNTSKPFVMEAADLIGRSPSAVSRKMGNLWAVWQPGSGMAHFGKLDRAVVGRYGGSITRFSTDPKGLERDLNALAHEADALRADLFERRPTARVEARGPEDESERLRLHRLLSEASHASGGEPLDVHLYERAGSWYIGFFIAAYAVLTNPAAIPAYLLAAQQIYPPFRDSIERLRRRIADGDSFGKEVASRILPDLEQRHFSGGELQAIAKKLTQYEVDPFRFNRKLALAFGKLAIADLERRVGDFFAINPPRDCQKCLIILAAAVRRALDNDARK